jgi:hypothetical protein
MANRRTEVARTSTEALKVLWKEGFFRSWKKKGPIVDKLDKRGNHFSDAELGMALMRANHLTRRGKRGAYEYIQKYPCVVDRLGSTTKEKPVMKRKN